MDAVSILQSDECPLQCTSINSTSKYLKVSFFILCVIHVCSINCYKTAKLENGILTLRTPLQTCIYEINQNVKDVWGYIVQLYRVHLFLQKSRCEHCLKVQATSRQDSSMSLKLIFKIVSK